MTAQEVLKQLAATEAGMNTTHIDYPIARFLEQRGLIRYRRTTRRTLLKIYQITARGREQAKQVVEEES